MARYMVERRKGLDGLVHLVLDFALFGYYSTPCSDNMALYERMGFTTYPTCLRCALWHASSA